MIVISESANNFGNFEICVLKKRNLLRNLFSMQLFHGLIT